jgi:hypothetical protein
LKRLKLVDVLFGHAARALPMFEELVSWCTW